MREYRTRLGSKGQATIPVEVRTLLGVAPHAGPAREESQPAHRFGHNLVRSHCSFSKVSAHSRAQLSGTSCVAYHE